MPVRLRCLVLLLSLLTLYVSTDAYAQGGPWIKPPGDYFVHLYGGAARSSNFYTINGDTRLFDTLGTTFSAVGFGLTVDYGLLNSLELNVDLPFGYFSISSEDKFPDRSIFAPVYFGLGATYQVTTEPLRTSVTSMIKIPPGFHRGIYDDPSHPSFLSDGFFQWTTLLHAGMSFDNVWVKAGIGYNWRDEEPLDEILYNAEIGLSSVEGSGAFVGFGGVVSTGDVTRPLEPFYAGASGSEEQLQQVDGGNGRFATIDRENYFAVSAGAFIYVTDWLMLDGRYVLRLFGRNTLELQGAYLGVGYKFEQ
jgi:hypothetical protein